MMTTNVAFVMDPIESITVYKDTTLALMLAAQKLGWRIHYLQPQNLQLRDGEAWADLHPLTVYDDSQRWFSLAAAEQRPLKYFDILFMRKDPPFDMDYIYSTYILERAEQAGCLVVNRPASLRDANEKMFTAWFPELCPPTLVAANMQRLREFICHHTDVVVKPLDGMGGASIFRLGEKDANLSVVLELMTQHGRRHIMAQRYLPEIIAGDKRLLMVGGQPVSHTLARIPAAGELRGNLAAGAQGMPQPITPEEQKIAQSIGPELVKRGLLFVGLDIIGHYLTEINVTSPTCVRELDRAHNLDIGGQLMAYLQAILAMRQA